MPLKNVRFNPTLVGDPSNLIKSAAAFTANAEIEASQAQVAFADNVKNVAIDYDKKKGAEEGRARAVNEGLRWRPEQAEAGSYVTIRARARNAAGFEAFKAQVQIDMRSKAKELAEEFKLDPDGFTNAWTSYTEGLTSGLTGEYADQVNLLALDRGALVSDTIRSNVNNINEQRHLVATFTNLQETVDEAINFAASGDAVNAAISYDEAVIAQQNLLDAGYIDAATFTTRVNALQQTLGLEWHKGVIDGLIEAGDVATLNSYIDGVLGVDGQGRRVLTNPIEPVENSSPFGGNEYSRTLITEETRERIGVYAQQKLKAFNAQRSGVNKDTINVAKDQLAGYKDRITEGAVVDAEGLDTLLATAQSTGDANLINDVNRLIAINNFLNVGENAFGNLTLRNQEILLAELKANPDTQANKELIDIAEKMYAAAQSGDISYGATRGWYTVEPLVLDDTLSEQLELRRSARQDLKARLGGDIDPSILTAEERTQLIGAAEQDPAILGAFVQGLTGDEINGFVQRLGIENPAVGIASLFYSQGNTALADEIMSGYQSSKQNPELNPDKKLYNEELFSVIGNLYGSSRAGSTQYDTVSRAIGALYNHRARQNNVDPSEINEEILQSAIDDVVGSTASLSSEGEFGDVDYVIPAPNPGWGDDATTFTEEWLNLLEASDFEGVDEYVAERLVEAGDSLRLVPALDGNRGYFVFIPGTSNLVRKADGSPFVLHYDEEKFPVQSGSFYGREVVRAEPEATVAVTEDAVVETADAGEGTVDEVVVEETGPVTMESPDDPDAVPEEPIYGWNVDENRPYTFNEGLEAGTVETEAGAVEEEGGGVLDTIIDFFSRNSEEELTSADSVVKAADPEVVQVALDTATQPNSTKAMAMDSDSQYAMAFQTITGSSDDLVFSQLDGINTINNPDGTNTHQVAFFAPIVAALPGLGKLVTGAAVTAGAYAAADYAFGADPEEIAALDAEYDALTEEQKAAYRTDAQEFGAGAAEVVAGLLPADLADYGADVISDNLRRELHFIRRANEEATGSAAAGASIAGLIFGPGKFSKSVSGIRNFLSNFATRKSGEESADILRGAVDAYRREFAAQQAELAKQGIKFRPNTLTKQVEETDNLLRSIGERIHSRKLTIDEARDLVRADLKNLPDDHFIFRTLGGRKAATKDIFDNFLHRKPVAPDADRGLSSRIQNAVTQRVNEIKQNAAVEVTEFAGSLTASTGANYLYAYNDLVEQGVPESEAAGLAVDYVISRSSTEVAAELINSLAGDTRFTNYLAAGIRGASMAHRGTLTTEGQVAAPAEYRDVSP